MEDHARSLPRWPHHRLFDADTRIADRQHDAVRLQMRPECSPCLGLLEGQERWSSFDDVHPAAKASKRLSELDADRAPAQYRERDRQLRRNRRLAVGPEL